MGELPFIVKKLGMSEQHCSNLQRSSEVKLVVILLFAKFEREVGLYFPNQSGVELSFY
jgi:hypothetical protein